METGRLSNKKVSSKGKEKPRSIQDWENEGGTVISQNAWNNYKVKTKNELDSLSETIRDLKSKLTKVGDNIAEKAAETTNHLIDDTEKSLHNAQHKYEELRNASQPAWQELKHGMEKALDDLRKSWQKAKNSFDHRT